MVKFRITIAEVEDTGLLVRHRLSMWNHIRPELRKQAQELEELTRWWINKKLSEGRLVGFIAKTQTGLVAGSGCIWIREQPPSLMNPRLEAPYLMSIYTEEAFRKKGVARLIIQRGIDWCREHGYSTITLHASEAGFPLYAALGFKPTSEMRITL
jgi:GNAT superfamily N-acetyltransferase